MASTNICQICSKGTKVAGKYSNRVRATKFNPTGNTRKYPNLQWVTLPKTLGGGRLRVCTRCMKANKHLEVTKKKK
jgi:ribosomal protein L28